MMKIRSDLNSGKADFSQRMGRRGKRWLAVILCFVGLIGMGMVLKSRVPVERTMKALSKLNPANEGASPDLRAGTRTVITDTRGGEASSVAAVAQGKRIFEQSNGVIKLRILSNGTYQVSMPGRPGEFRTWEGQKPLDAENPFKVPAGIFIKVRNRAGEIIGGGWHSPLIHSSSISMPIFGREKLVDVVGDSGLVDLCDLTAFLSDEIHKLPEFSDLEFKLLVKPSMLMLFKPDGSPVDISEIETGWISGRYLTKYE